MRKGDLRLPDFIIIGAEKAGTTWLGARLDEQEGVFLSNPFELHYFDHEENYSRGPEWYASQFAAAPEDALLGEKTPGYLWVYRPLAAGPQDIPERMHKLLPDVKVIVILRDPVDRAISAFNHDIKHRYLSPFVKPDRIFDQAMKIDEDRFGLVSQSLYARNLERYFKLYPREQIQVLFFEDDTVKAPQQTLEGVMRFLGRDSRATGKKRRRGDLLAKKRWWVENKRMNSRMGLVMNYYAPALSPVIAAIDRLLPEQPAITPPPDYIERLYEYFAPENRALFDMVGRSTDAWRPGKKRASATAA